VLPQCTYQAKKIVCPLGLKMDKIYACRNDCMLFHKNDAMLRELFRFGTDGMNSFGDMSHSHSI
jgi:hypothetical protein